eukprot:TRINITY_DN66722_c1_g1_i1.p1 TRINITY_DN66722_c1_g1~~TRINITY_DN66722_c1_g1_i1.p1  ORF type:complete len:280 (-),score=15.37 TRINITY_DN66722_c1_g1_i1:115-861(-)
MTAARSPSQPLTPMTASLMQLMRCQAQSGGTTGSGAVELHTQLGFLQQQLQQLTNLAAANTMSPQPQGRQALPVQPPQQTATGTPAPPLQPQPQLQSQPQTFQPPATVTTPRSNESQGSGQQRKRSKCAPLSIMPQSGTPVQEVGFICSDPNSGPGVKLEDDGVAPASLGTAAYGNTPDDTDATAALNNILSTGGTPGGFPSSIDTPNLIPPCLSPNPFSSGSLFGMPVPSPLSNMLSPNRSIFSNPQ